MSDFIARNLALIHEQIGLACNRTSRDRADVRLVAVTKSATIEQIQTLIQLGVRDLAENRPQQLLKRAGELPGEICWHMIGHLQRNKAEMVARRVDWIHSVDSPRLMEAIEKALHSDPQPRSNPLRLLLEVNVSGETSKGGFAPNDVREFWKRHIATLSQVRPSTVCGLMTMAPASDDPEQARPVFRALRELRDELQAEPGSPPLPHLSMGMSSDYIVAVEEGATMVRIGSRLFEE